MIFYNKRKLKKYIKKYTKENLCAKIYEEKWFRQKFIVAYRYQLFGEEIVI